MSGSRKIKPLDTAIFLVVGSGLLVAALLSERFVPTPPASALALEPPAIEYRDQFYGVAVAGDSTLWLAGGGGKILKSEDSGAGFSLQQTPSGENLQDVAAWDPERAVAVGNEGVVLLTENGGDDWIEVETPRSMIVNKLFRVVALPEGRAWAVGAGGMILHSGDGGRSWRQMREEEDVAWNGIDFVGPDRGWVVGEFGRILRTADGGESWEEIASPVERSLMGVDFMDESRGVAVGLDGLILRSGDGGETWEQIDSGTTAHLFDVHWGAGSWM